MAASQAGDRRESKVGVHSMEHDPQFGLVDVLHVTGPLATAESEREIRVRVGAFARIPTSLVAPVHRVDRDGDVLRIISAPVEGIRVSELLDQLARRRVTLSDQGILDLIARAIASLAALHKCDPSVAHGAIASDHLVLTGDGIVFTEAVFGGALATLQWPSERVWNTFRVALPHGGCFDQRSDVTQLAAVILAIALRRPLRVDEYPRCAAPLVMHATETLAARSALRMWLQQALQLHARATFTSAVDAGRGFVDLLVGAAGQRAANRVLRTSA
jgi:hypothetical protein